ncbi:MAG: BON domain-containing protein [Parachlamydiaceae bacterium]|nr:BON domain-containing protein [Parachlamydiaceae bacterium]
MNRDTLESQWPQIRDMLREKFSNLTEEDIKQINGRYDQLVAKLQQKYGYSREEAEERIKSWNFDRFATPQRSTTVHEEKYHPQDNVKEDNSSLFKWLLGIGIPLLLLAYFLAPTGNETTNTTTTSRDQTMGETQADRTISSDLRNALIEQNVSGSQLQNIQVTTRNGIVTLSGTVPNNEVRDVILNTSQNLPGVRQVVNNLQVR